MIPLLLRDFLVTDESDMSMQTGKVRNRLMSLAFGWLVDFGLVGFRCVPACLPAWSA